MPSELLMSEEEAQKLEEFEEFSSEEEEIVEKTAEVGRTLVPQLRLMLVTKGKGKGRALVIAPQVDALPPQRRSGTWRAPSSVAHTCLIPSQP